MANRRNLVLLRAGDSSIHPAWLNAPGEERNWDLIINYFGDDPNIFKGDDWLRIDSKGPKLLALHEFILKYEDLISNYDYIWLPDEDLSCTCRSINLLFDKCREHALKLAQPSLTHDSYFTHPITLHNPYFRLRFTTFVEMMAPCFSAAALKVVLPTMTESLSGWGVDFIWGKMLGTDPAAIAIIDDVQIRHTRPVGGGKLYDLVREMGGSAWDEQQRIEKKYDIPRRRFHIRKAILRSGRTIQTGPRLTSLYSLGLLRAALHMRKRWSERPRMFGSAMWQQMTGRP